MAISDKLTQLIEIKEGQRALLDLSNTLPWADYLEAMVKKSEYDGLLERYNQLLNSEYTITYNLTDVTLSHNDSTVRKNASYASTFILNEGYTINSITITEGGTDVTSSVYSEGKITFEKVTGNVVITASSIGEEFTITNILTNITSDGASVISYGRTYAATLTASTGYNLPLTVNVTMGGRTLLTSEYTYDSTSGTLSIPNVKGNIELTASGLLKTFSVTKNGTNLTISGNNTVSYGTNYVASLAPSEGYNLPSAITVTMGGAEIPTSGYTYDRASGALTVNNVTDAIIITATGELKVFSVTTDWTGSAAAQGRSDNPATNADYGTSYVANLSTTNFGYTIRSIVVTMGDEDISSTAVSGQRITIDKVTGNIVITATVRGLLSVGQTSSEGYITINDDADLAAGTYTMQYIDNNNEPIADVDKITTFTIE